MPAIYVDTSIVLAHIQLEARRPKSALLKGTILGSRLVEYEAWNRIHARQLEPLLGQALRSILGRFAFVELAPMALRYVKQPWPTEVRTLDAIHLSTMRYLLDVGTDLSLYTFDTRMAKAASTLGIRCV